MFIHALQSQRSRGCRSKRCHWRWLGEGMAKGAAASAIEALGAAGTDAALLVTVGQVMGQAISDQAEALRARHRAEHMGEVDGHDVTVDDWHAIDLEEASKSSALFRMSEVDYVCPGCGMRHRGPVVMGLECTCGCRFYIEGDEEE